MPLMISQTATPSTIAITVKSNIALLRHFSPSDRPVLHGMAISAAKAEQSAHTLGECSFQLTQNAVRFTDGKVDDFIGARLQVTDGVDAQLRRVARWPEMRDIAVVEVNAHAVKNIDAGDIVESKRGCEETC